MKIRVKRKIREGKQGNGPDKGADIMIFIQNCRYRILLAGLCAMLFITAMVISGCSSCTKPEEGIISGKVILVNDTDNPSNDPVDFSGVTISLYKLAEVDTALARLNAVFPQTGIQLNQNTEFDHRLEVPIATATSNAEGYFEFKVTKNKQYNITMRKDGWGLVVRHDVTANNKDSNSNESFREDFGTVNMYPEVSVPLQNVGAYTFQTDHTYLMNSDTSILGACHFEGGSRIILGQAVNLNLHGTAEFDSTGVPTWLYGRDTSDNPEEIPRWGSICIYANNSTVSNLVIWDATSGVSMYGSYGTIKKVFIKSSSNGLYLPSDYSQVQNCVFTGIEARAIVYNQSESSAEIKHRIVRSLFYKCTECTRTLGQNVSITDNYFLDNNQALISFKYFHQAKYNNFDRNKAAIVLNGSPLEIKYNNFYQNEESLLFSIAYYTGYSNPVIQENNFYQTSGFAIKLWPRTINQDISATQNYWKSEDIPGIVWDVDDMPLVEYHLVYLPKYANPVSSAGIRGL